MSENGNEKKICGIIMPISGNDSYTAEHWCDVKAVLEEVIVDTDFVPNLVSDADEIGIIHNRIVSNIYSNPIIICDVSSKNPNVMFELGLRLAFDKATIIIKDDTTNYNFDTAPIEHLTYPRDLRYSTINKFKAKLKEKLCWTYKASLSSEYSTFLKSFVQYKPKLDVREISSQEYFLKQFEQLSKQISDLKRNERQVQEIELSRIDEEFAFQILFDRFIAKHNKEVDFENMPTEEITGSFLNYLKDLGGPLPRNLVRNFNKFQPVTYSLIKRMRKTTA